jgi:hypothetical protein
MNNQNNLSKIIINDKKNIEETKSTIRKTRGRPSKNKINNNINLDKINISESNEYKENTMNLSEHREDKELLSEMSVKENTLFSEMSVKENTPLIEDNSLSNIDTDNYIRPPDKIKKERLIDYNYTEEDENDEEIMRIIHLSRIEYYNNFKTINNNLLSEDILNNYRDDLNFNNDYYEEIFKENNYINDHVNDNINDHINDHINEEDISELIINESKKIEIEKRINSLSNFTKMIKKINPIYFTEKENTLKKYIEENLDNYFNLTLDKIIVEDEEFYNDLFSMIDSYYIIPKNKNYKKYIITEEEDKLLRIIFVK